MKILTFLSALLVIGIGPVFSQQVISFNQEKTDISISQSTLSDLVITNTIDGIKLQEVTTPIGDFVSIISNQGIKTRKVGLPDLPQIRHLIEIPEGCMPSVEIISLEEETIDLDSYTALKLIPAQLSINKQTNPEDVPFEYNQAAYATDEFMSSELARVQINGRMRERTLGTLIISPYKYNPVSNELIVTTKVNVRVHFDNPNMELEQRKKLYASPVFGPSYSRVINPLMPTSSQKDAIVTYPTKYVIVADPMFQNILQPLVQWKTKKGFTVIEAYTNDPAVGTTTTSIKNYLEGLYNAATSNDPAPSYVLFVGDVDQIPSFTGTTGPHASDLYYCEYDGGGDYFPEVYYGRLSANNVNELQPQVDKILEYEQYLFPDDSFLEDVVLVAGVDANFAPTHGNGQINYGTDNYFNATNGLDPHVWLYPQSGSSASAIINQISEGASFANYTAHCGPSGWADPSFGVSDVSSLTNAHKYPTMVGNCCQSNAFDSQTCFGEALLRAPDKGAIGYIGGSNNTLWDEDYYWGVGNGPVSANPTYAQTDLGIYDCLFHSNGETVNDWYYTQGQIIFSGNMAVTQAGGGNVKYYWEIYHLMGDPSLMTYIGVPSTMVVSHTPVDVIGITSLTVTAEPHAYIAVSQNGILLDAQYTGSGSSVTLTFPSIATIDDLDVVVTKQNRKPYIGIVDIIAPSNTPYVIMNTNNHDDAAGNSNGAIDYSETISLDVELKNIGDLTANNVVAVLSTTDPYVTITDDTESWGSMNAGAQQMILASYDYQVANNIPDQHLIEFTLSISDSDGNNWSGTINVTANAPMIEILDLTILDSQIGNGNGRLDAGETVTLEITTENNGHADLNSGNGTVTTTSPEITIDNGTDAIGTMEVGILKTGTYQITVDASTPYGTAVSLNKVCGDQNYSNTKDFELIVGLQDEDFESGDFSQYTWAPGTSPWTVVTEAPYEGTHCSKSGTITDNQSSDLSITLDVLTAGEVSFMRKISSESGYDYLKFFIDGALQDEWSGISDWTPETFPVSSGTHTFKWEYYKDASVSEGSDAAWVDYILFPPIAENTSGISDLNTDEINFTVYPNPSSEEITILIHNQNENIEHDIFVKDMRGRIVKQLQSKSLSTTLNISDLSSGPYFVELLMGSSVKRLRIVKQ
ncbi:MAG: C25 family cysteine peptidase [Crocinitomicaceae bacterium]|nr:C25 family cysteine peptidase [Crocinitomicaceae bacterium]